jgi:hypothetical protein
MCPQFARFATRIRGCYTKPSCSAKHGQTPQPRQQYLSQVMAKDTQVACKSAHRYRPERPMCSTRHSLTRGGRTPRVASSKLADLLVPSMLVEKYAFPGCKSFHPRPTGMADRAQPACALQSRARCRYDPCMHAWNV